MREPLEEPVLRRSIVFFEGLMTCTPFLPPLTSDLLMTFGVEIFGPLFGLPEVFLFEYPDDPEFMGRAGAWMVGFVSISRMRLSV